MGNTIVYNGVVYKLLGKYYLSQSTTNKGRKNPKSLHREIWKDNFGEIPEGYDVHHKDGNTLNNNINNLEIISKRDHARLHSEKNFMNSEYREKNKQHLLSINDKAKERHGSDEGKERHKKHYYESIGKIEPKEFKCKQCGKIFLSRKNTPRYCSLKCIRESYKIEMECSVCGKKFMRNKYRKSRKCEVCSKKTREFI